MEEFSIDAGVYYAVLQDAFVDLEKALVILIKGAVDGGGCRPVAVVNGFIIPYLHAGAKTAARESVQNFSIDGGKPVLFLLCKSGEKLQPVPFRRESEQTAENAVGQAEKLFGSGDAVCRRAVLFRKENQADIVGMQRKAGFGGQLFHGHPVRVLADKKPEQLLLLQLSA